MPTEKSKSKKKSPRKPVAAEWIDFDKEATYADSVRSSAGERHFLLSFAQSRPNSNKHRIVSQVVLAPKTAAELAIILSTQVARYEKAHGKITPGGVKLGIVEAKD